MKKILAMIMALVLMLSLCACGAKTEAPAPAPAPAETPAETPAEAPAEEVTWPEYPVSLVVAASAGGGTDLCARVMAEELSTYGGASFGVVNQTEGSGVVAYEQVLSSDPEACDTLTSSSVRTVGSFKKVSSIPARVQRRWVLSLRVSRLILLSSCFSLCLAAVSFRSATYRSCFSFSNFSLGIG